MHRSFRSKTYTKEEIKIPNIVSQEAFDYHGRRLVYDNECDIVVSEDVLKQYNLKKSEMKDPNEVVLFHGTKIWNLPNIITNGFNPNQAGMTGVIGKGTYFSDLISQSIFYSCDYYTGNETEFIVLVCRVCLGNSKYIDRYDAASGNCSKQADSHWTQYYDKDGYKVVHAKEYCIFDSNQILPWKLLYLRACE